MYKRTHIVQTVWSKGQLYMCPGTGCWEYGTWNTIAGLVCHRQSENCYYICVCWLGQKRDILSFTSGTSVNKHHMTDEVGIYSLPVLRKQLRPMSSSYVWTLVPWEHYKPLESRDCFPLLCRSAMWAKRCLSISIGWRSCPCHGHSLPFRCSNSSDAQ